MTEVLDLPAEVSSFDEAPARDPFADLAAWVVSKATAWRDWRDQNYSAEWDRYEKLWRCRFAGNEGKSTRSTIVTPGLAEAVENGAAEIEASAFGRGDYFDLQLPAGVGGQVAPMVDAVRRSLREDLARGDFAAEMTEIIINGAIYGTGIGAIAVETTVLKVPAMDFATGKAVAREIRRDEAVLRSVNPRNFIIDPTAKTIVSGMGCAVEEYVGRHIVEQAIRDGIYRDVDFELDAGDQELLADRLDETEYSEDKVLQLRYYGLVPAKMLNPTPEEDAEAEELSEEEQVGPTDDGELVEALVVIANDKVTLKAEANPWLMQDRPVVAFPFDTVPGRFWGRGICEKGEPIQSIVDTETRARMDALKLSLDPMMAVDANRVPKGFDFKVRPGRTIPVTGDPTNLFREVKFGAPVQEHYANIAVLQGMLQQATGSLDAAKLAQGMGDARSGAASMVLAPITKRYRRSFVNFVDLCLAPAIEKIAWRNMQYDPKRYPPIPVQVVPTSTMGVMQRELENAHLTALLGTIQQGTPEHRAVLLAIIGNMSISNRAQVMALVAAAEQREMQEKQAALMAQAQASQDPMQQQLAAALAQLKIAETQATIRKLNAEAAEAEADAQQTMQEISLEAVKIAQKGLYSIEDPELQAQEFDRRYKLALLQIKQGQLAESREGRMSDERIADKQLQASLVKEAVRRQPAQLATPPMPAAAPNPGMFPPSGGLQ